MEYSDFQGEKISRLGFGMMRLPQKDGRIDEPLVFQMVQDAIAHGVNYFDTAWPYHDGFSEVVTGRALARYPRDTFFLASKYPGHQYVDEYTPALTFETQLKKCGVQYFDFYLLHNVCESSIGVYTSPKWKILEYFVEQKRLGRIKHLGFSSHAELDTLKEWLEFSKGNMEFCQIQLNYLDWTLQKAKQKYDLLTEMGIPVWVMEPVRGGKLARLTPPLVQKLKELRPQASMASWAFEWLRQLPNVKVILSGMSDLDQLADNLSTFSGHHPLNEAEHAALADVAKSMHQMIPCTACRYCMDVCPQELPIPVLLAILDEARFTPTAQVGMRIESLPQDKLATACIGCGSCENICPQKIPVPSLMQELAQMMPTLPSWRAICAARAASAAAFTQK